MAGNLYEVLAGHRAAVLDREASALQRIQRAYATAYADIARRALDLLLREGASATFDYRYQRYRALMEQMAEELHAAGMVSLREVSDGQAWVVARSDGWGRELFATQGPTIAAAFNRAPAAALESLVGVLGDGSPLLALLDEFGTTASEAGQSALAIAVASGWNPRKAAREIEQALRTGEPAGGFAAKLLGPAGDLRQRSETIARTEIIRSHRLASLQNYGANSDVVSGWEWVATFDLRTCIVCIAMDGSIHKLDELFGTHIQCRCTPAPWFGGAIDRKTGAEWFARLSREEQVQVLGPGKAVLYWNGQAQLMDFVASGDDPHWGPWRAEKSLKSMGFGPGNPPDPPKGQSTGGDSGGGKSPVSSHFDMGALSPEHKAELEHALGIIDSIHTDGGLPKIRAAVVSQEDHDDGTLGLYHPSGYKGPLIENPHLLALSPDKFSATAIHEVGHAIDLEVFGTGKKGGSRNHPAMEEWRRAVYSTREIQYFEHLHDIAEERVQKAKALGIKPSEDDEQLLEWTEYMIMPEEMWARSYAQYIAVKYNQQGLIDRIINDAGAPRQWQKESFGPIFKGVENALKKIGWI